MQTTASRGILWKTSQITGLAHKKHDIWQIRLVTHKHGAFFTRINVTKVTAISSPLLQRRANW